MKAYTGGNGIARIAGNAFYGRTTMHKAYKIDEYEYKKAQKDGAEVSIKEAQNDNDTLRRLYGCIKNHRKQHN